MGSLIRYFVARSFQTNLISIAIIVLGLYSVGHMVRQVLPFSQANVVLVDITFPNATPRMVEREVTFPIEEALMGLPAVESISSSSKSQNARIELRWSREGTTETQILEAVKSKVDSIRWKLPAELERLEIRHKTERKSAAMVLVFTGVELDKSEHYQWLEFAKRELLSTPFVVDVESREAKRSLYIQFDSQLVTFHGLNTSEVIAKVMSTLQQVSIGSVEKHGRNITLEVDKAFDSIEALEAITIKASELYGEVRLKDIAEIEFKSPHDTFLEPINGDESIFIRVYQDVEADAIDVVDALNNKVKELNKALPEPLQVKIVDRATEFLEQQFTVLIGNAILGLVLVSVVLIYFLGVRTAISTSLGVFIAYMGTFFVLVLFNVPLDLISVMAIILVLGILVDDSIVISEAYSTEIAKSPNSDGGKVATSVAKRMIVPISGGLVTTMIAFSPMLFSQTASSKMFYAIPVVIMVALIVSWIECFFILPNHLVHMSSGVKPRSQRLFASLSKGYTKVLNGALKFRYIIASVSLVALLALSHYYYGKTKLDFNLRLGMTKVTISAVLNDAKSTEDALAQIKPVQDYLVSLRERFDINVVTQPGQANLGGILKQGDRYVQFSIFVKILKGNYQEVVTGLRGELSKGLPAIKNEQFEVLELAGGRRGGGNSDAINIFISGKDRISIDGLQDKLTESLSQVPGMKGFYFDNDRVSETWTFVPNYRVMQQYGMSEKELLDQISPVFAPRKLGFTRFEGKHVDIYSEVQNSDTFMFEYLKTLTISTPDFQSLPANVFGHWEQGESLRNITHKDGLRTYKVAVRFDESVTDNVKFKAAVAEQLAPIDMAHPDYSISTESADTTLDETQAWIKKMLIFCLLGVVLVIAFTLGSLSKVLLALSPLPFGILFVVMIFNLNGYHLDVIAMIGLLGVMGISVNSAIIMIHAISHNQVWSIASVIDGAVSRVRAITLTTITTLAGVFPMAYGLGGESGYTKSIALSLSWGLLGSTVITLVLLPVLIVTFFEVRDWVNDKLMALRANAVPDQSEKNIT